MIRLSQRHLKILETCPRQFEHIYFDRLTPPMSPMQQVKTQLGSDFHLLMQLDGWMKAIIATAPELFAANNQAWRESEHVRTIAIDNYLFTAIYDLVILTPDKADIIDWKTYPLPRYKKDLDLEWQTRLYLYTLAETSDYLPKQINFTYWFIQSTPQPKSVRIGYTLKQHRQTEADIRELLRKLTDWLDAYQTRGEPFPQVAESVGACQYCNFAARCDRQQQPESAPAHLIQDFENMTATTHRLLEQIPAVPI
jgi:PD-(D/E)XK nuclease superfamily